MDRSAQSTAAIFGWGGILIVMLVGVALLFSRPTNIERQVMVGGITILGSLVSSFLMHRSQAAGGPINAFQVFGFVFIAFAFFGWAWLLDYALGPLPVDREADEDTFGAHLSA